MTATKGQNFQDVQNSALPVIGKVARTANEDIMLSVDKHLDSPFRLAAGLVPDVLLRISASKVLSGDGSKKSAAPADDLVNDFVATTIDFSNDAVVGGNVTLQGGAFALPTGTQNYYRRMCFVYVSADNRIDSIVSDENVALAGLENPGLLFASLDGQPIGWIDIQNVDGFEVYKSADAVSPVITNDTIYRFGGGAGGGAGGDTSFKLQGISANIATIKKGSMILDNGLELLLATNLAVDLLNDPQTGVLSPAASTNYYLYVDLYTLPNSTASGDSDRLVRVVSANNFVVLATPPAQTNPARFAPIASMKTNGSSDYTLFDNLANKRHNTVAGFIATTQKKTYQINTEVASTVTPHGLSGEPTVSLSYFNGTKKVGVDLSSHLLNKDITNIEISTLGLTMGGGQYLEVEAAFIPSQADHVVSLQHSFTSAWMDSNAIVTLPHGLIDAQDIRGYEVQEWDVTTNKIRNVDRSALIVNFDGTNFYLDWTGLLPTVNLQYRVVGGGTAIPAMTPLDRPFIVTGNFTARIRDKLVLQNVAPVTITLPANPAVGDVVTLYDGNNNWDTQPVTVNRNGQLLNGAASNLTLDIKRSHAEIIFIGGSQGWSKYPSTVATFA